MSQTQPAPKFTNVSWRKSTRSAHEGECVEIAVNLSGVVAVRDSKDPEGSKVLLSRASFRRLVGEIRAHGADL
jgi:hypothetical protein